MNHDDICVPMFFFTTDNDPEYDQSLLTYLENIEKTWVFAFWTIHNSSFSPAPTFTSKRHE